MCDEKEAKIPRMSEGAQMRLPDHNECRKINSGGNAATVAGVG